MSDLRTVLAREAENVPLYDVGPKVLRAARRRRRWRTGGVAVAVVVALAGLAGIVVALRPAGLPAGVVVADRPPTAMSLPWLPATIDTTLAEPPPPLPVDRGVGPGALVYQPCSLPCSARLVTEDGKQYALPAITRMPPAAPRKATLSPDGRWLSYPDAEGEYLLRDLTGTRTVPLGNRRATGWSAGTHWVGLADARTEDGVEVIVPPADGATPRPLPAGEARPLAGLTTDGAAVFGGTESYADGDPVDLRLVDKTGTGRAVPINADDWMKDSENLRSGTLIRTVDDDSVLVQLMVESGVGPGATATPGDLLHIDTTSGEVLARLRLPRPGSTTTVNGESATTARGDVFRALAGTVPDGILLKVIRDGSPAAIELLDLGTGDRSTVATLTGKVVDVAVRGES